jgi:beta-glucosidase
MISKLSTSVDATSSAMRATGVFWDFAPVSDISRDTRWGRYYETLSEDPELSGTMAASLAKGLQAYDGTGATAKLAATAKHFAGYSEPLGGHDRVPAQIPVRESQDTFLPSFQSQIDAGVKTAMANSGAVNGVPVHASKFMLTTELRQRMGFNGVTVSDWSDMASPVTKYHLAPDYPTAIAMSVNAGVDMAMEPSDAAGYTTDLINDVHNGLISQRRIDEAVSRILTLKFSSASACSRSPTWTPTPPTLWSTAPTATWLGRPRPSRPCCCATTTRRCRCRPVHTSSS